MIGIIGAMKEEIDEIVKLMQVQNETKILTYHFIEGKIADKDVVVLQGGIGKVNASLSTTLLLDHFDIDCVINIGSAGGLKRCQNVGDIVISSKVVHHDVDITAFGREIGEVPDMPRFFEPDADLLYKVNDILKKLNIDSHIGLIGSGDQFISRQDQVDKIITNFPDIMCAEMEAASIAQVCHIYNVKFIITRSLSDIFNKGENHIQFDEYLKEASQKSAKMCYHLISSL